MAAQFSTTVRNAWLNAVETVVGTSPRLQMYTGSKPANCAATATGTKLAEVECPSDWLEDASNGSKALKGTWAVAASATGTAG